MTSAKQTAGYPPEFRAEAVRLARTNGKPYRQIAHDLGMTTKTLRKWLKQADPYSGKRQDGLTTEEQEKAHYPVRRMGRVLGVSPSGYWAWRHGTDVPVLGGCIILIMAASIRRKLSPIGVVLWESSVPWARSVIATITPWPRAALLLWSASFWIDGPFAPMMRPAARSSSLSKASTIASGGTRLWDISPHRRMKGDGVLPHPVSPSRWLVKSGWMAY